MDSDQNSARLPWVAVALSFLSSGVGHLYGGHIVKGLFLYSARFLLPLLFILAAFLQPSNGVFVCLLLVPAVATAVVYLYSPIDAYAVAKREGSDYRLKEYNRTSLYWLLIAMQLAYPVTLTWAVREYVYEPFLVPSRSMSPNVLAGDRVLVNKRSVRNGFPERGDVIAFRAPASEVASVWVKRVLGVAGDRILIRGREIEVNGKKLELERVPMESVAQIRNQVDGKVFYESYAGRRYSVMYSDGPLDESIEGEFDLTVPDRCVFVLGDNRDRSRDSRHIGSIHVGDVIGYVDYTYFPAETWSRCGVFQD